jgi:SAM-dependent methyltransferase
MQEVKEQYESYPYPPRNPADERTRLVRNSGFTLAAIDHFVHAGKRDWSRPFRALVAGGGTGDAVIALAQYMKDANVPGEVVYLDLSTASRQIAEERAAIRGLTNIVFRSGSLLDLSAHVDGQFDFINCIGVLHHLEEPAAGLHALNGVLAPDGGMNLMVYASLGRWGVYPVQRMLRQIAPSHLPSGERVAMARRLLGVLPKTNLLSLSPQIKDHQGGIGPAGDAAIYDLLLHSVDRAYLITEFNDLITAEGLRISGFLQKCLYDPAFWCSDPVILKAVQDLDVIERAQFTENLLGFIMQHNVFVVRRDNPTAAPELTPESVPVWGAEYQEMPGEGGFEATLPVLQTPIKIRVSDPEGKVWRLIDGNKTVAQIGEESGLPPSVFDSAIRNVFSLLHGLGRLFLRHAVTG